MNHKAPLCLNFRSIPAFLFLFLVVLHQAVGQVPVSNRSADFYFKSGRELYEQDIYALAAQSLQHYLNRELAATERLTAELPTQQRAEARYYAVLSGLKNRDRSASETAAAFVAGTHNKFYRERAAFALARQYFILNRLDSAILYYEIAGLANLSNQELADAKFELAYSYFNQAAFDRALPLFAAIKDLPSNKYYIPGNYYYGLLAYNNKDYKEALKSFKRIHNQEVYKEVVPYYEAEIHYFLGESDKVMDLSRRYLAKGDSLYYSKEMHLLRAQTLFEANEFEEALPHFEYYYERSDKIRKEELYELAYTYYRLDRWEEAVAKFQPLSNAQDSLGQTSMYLLGDCYLKIGDKTGGRNAFGICAEMDFNPMQQEAARFLYAKLSFELGDEAVATRGLYDFVQNYPQSEFNGEAKTLLTSLLAKESNYKEAFAILNSMAVKDAYAWRIFQQVAVGRGLQLMQDKSYQAADSVLSLSLQQPSDPVYEAIAYFWKAEIAYLTDRYPQAVTFERNFLQKAEGRERPIQRVSANATTQNARMTMGYAYLNQGRYADAQAEFAAAQQSSQAGHSTILEADAALRQADALFMQKDFAGAITYYDRAIAADVSEPDYARYQKALIYGLQGQHQDKINLLTTLVSKVPASDYRNAARYELALSQQLQGNIGDATRELRALKDDHSVAESLRSKAHLRLAGVYQQAGQYKEAEQAYRSYMQAYPAASDKEHALDALRNLYINLGEPEQYAAYLEENALPGLQDESLENTYYDAATQDYGLESWEKAAEGFSKYLDRFPAGKFASKAHYYRGEAYFKMKQYEKALADYEAVQAGGWNDFAEDAAGKAAGIALQREDYEKAGEQFQNLRTVAADEQSLQEAYEGLMITSFNRQAYNASGKYADTLLSIPGLTRSRQTNANLYKAKAFQQTSDILAARQYYDKVIAENLGELSAEARYRLAEIAFDQKQLKEAESLALESAQSSGGYDYWVVKSYLLLGDILTGQEDYFNAKATFQSIVKNAADPGLKAEANSKLEQVVALEKAQSKLQNN